MKPEKGALSFFQLALAVRSELHKQFGNEQPINVTKITFKKFISFLHTYSAITIVGFSPVGALQ